MAIPSQAGGAGVPPIYWVLIILAVVVYIVARMFL
jgi:hypothetical protein